MSQTHPPRDSGDSRLTRQFPVTFPTTIGEYTGFLSRCREERDEFWRSCAGRLTWDTPFSAIVREDFTTADIAWFPDGTLNACVNALDDHLAAGNGAQPALVTIGSSGEHTTMTYEQLSRQTTSLAAALKARGLGTDDRVALSLPDCPEAVLFMLACARLGITVVPIPVRFTAEVAAEIVNDCGASLVVVWLDSGRDSLNERAREIVSRLGDTAVISIGNETAGDVRTLSDFIESGDSATEVPPVSVPAEHPLCILYASSAAGIPRGSVYATGGFLVQAFASSSALFSFSEETAARNILSTIDMSSAAGLSLGLWGTFLTGKTLVFAECTADITPELLARAASSLDSPALVTTPQVISALRQKMGAGTLPEGNRFTLVTCSGDTLTPRLVTFAGEALTAGRERVLNLWIQNETGAPLIFTFPVPDLNRTGALGLPFPGTEPIALNNYGEPCRTNESGQLVFLSSWPSMIRTIWGQPERYREFYFLRTPGNFSTSDGVRVDGEGFFWFMGRLDDVIKIRGQSLATSEIEAVLMSHEEVSEAAVISAWGDDLDALYAFIVLTPGRDNGVPLDSLEEKLRNLIIRRIGEFAVPTGFIFSSGLPRTRTGKIVRRILRRVVSGDISMDDDLSHVANPQTVEELIYKKGSPDSGNS